MTFVRPFSGGMFLLADGDDGVGVLYGLLRFDLFRVSGVKKIFKI